MAAFLFPYAWFVAVHWSKARFVPADDTIPLLKALSVFIFNGGVDWHLGWSVHWSFAAFLFLLAYNFLRAALLWKTKTLELQQDASGLPAQFSLSMKPWGTLFQLARWGLWLNLVIVALNTVHFFTQRIPLPPG